MSRAEHLRSAQANGWRVSESASGQSVLYRHRTFKALSVTYDADGRVVDASLDGRMLRGTAVAMRVGLILRATETNATPRTAHLTGN